MSIYYIKLIWGPAGQEGYPHEDKTEFAGGGKTVSGTVSYRLGRLKFPTII